MHRAISNQYNALYTETGHKHDSGCCPQPENSKLYANACDDIQTLLNFIYEHFEF